MRGGGVEQRSKRRKEKVAAEGVRQPSSGPRSPSRPWESTKALFLIKVLRRRSSHTLAPPTSDGGATKPE